MIKTRDKGEIVYYIPKGGSNLLGMLGYYDCAVELDEQAKHSILPVELYTFPSIHSVHIWDCTAA